ncbi:substrate-binding domain-containing protein [Tessaracoccus sp. MC1756]|uniref:substrate-binding domain-containing protein n=1 Tax=Tessaracoccus sp. MC1756 TaxID=2760311 RepID=UPI001C720DAA|nr:substrate-binding domain-containing protein [Tessaracoccus sp. MC1756]
MRTKKPVLAAVAVGLSMMLAACAPSTTPAPAETSAGGGTTASESAGGETTASGSASAEASASTSEVATGDPVKVAIIYSKTGPLAAYGETYYQGFQAGLDYATDGSGAVDGRELEITYTDDGGDPDKAVAAAKEAIGNGTKIMGGTVSSGVAGPLAEQAEQNKVLYISGPAAADAITGINRYTFRSGRQSLQDVATTSGQISDGSKVLVFAQNSAFGQGNVAAAKAILEPKGAVVSELLVPEAETEFTPFAARILDAKPDLVFVAWAGATSGAMWQALSQQGVLESTNVMTGLGDLSTYGAYGEASDKINFLNHYFPGAPDNEVNDAMVSFLDEGGHQADLFSPDGFVAAQMIVQAVREGGGDDVDEMIASLEGWEFDAPKGPQQIRESDHAMIQPMFVVKLKEEGGQWVPELVETMDGADVAPPEAS